MSTVSMVVGLPHQENSTFKVFDLDLKWAARKVVDVCAVLTSGAIGVVVHRDGITGQRRFHHSGKSFARTW
jgi:hypothetical protein